MMDEGTELEGAEGTTEPSGKSGQEQVNEAKL